MVPGNSRGWGDGGLCFFSLNLFGNREEAFPFCLLEPGAPGTLLGRAAPLSCDRAHRASLPWICQIQRNLQDVKFTGFSVRKMSGFSEEAIWVSLLCPLTQSTSCHLISSLIGNWPSWVTHGRSAQSCRCVRSNGISNAKWTAIIYRISLRLLHKALYNECLSFNRSRTHTLTFTHTHTHTNSARRQPDRREQLGVWVSCSRLNRQLVEQTTPRLPDCRCTVPPEPEPPRDRCSSCTDSSRVT